MPRLEVHDLNLWTRPFLRSGLLSPEDPRLKPEVRDAIRRLGALEEGRPPFVPLASLGELLGASPEEREAAMAALSLEELRHFRKEFPESLLLGMTSSTGPFRSGLSEGSAASWRGTSPGA